MTLHAINVLYLWIINNTRIKDMIQYEDALNEIIEDMFFAVWRVIKLNARLHISLHSIPFISELSGN